MRQDLYSPKLWDAMIAGKLNAGVAQVLTGAGAVSLATFYTKLVTTGANALTLADGEEGQLKLITMVTDGGDGTLTPATFLNGTTLTFADVGDTVLLLWETTGGWVIVSNSGAAVA